MTQAVHGDRGGVRWRLRAAVGSLMGALLLGAGAGEYAAPADPFPVAVALDGDAVSGLRVSVRVTVPGQHRLYAEAFAVDAVPPVRLVPLNVPEPIRLPDPFSGGHKAVYTGSFTAVYAVADGATGRLEVVVRRQGCSADVCFLPTASTVVLDATATAAPTAAAERRAAPGALLGRFVVAARHSGMARAEEFVRFLDVGRAAAVRGATANAVADGRPRGSLWGVLLAILAGGLALNLTPCVLPMIPVNLAILGAGGGGGRGRGFRLGALYGAGIAAAYGALGLIVVLTGATFGAVNATPWFNLAVAVLFGVLALAMFDVWTLDFSRFQSRLGSAGRSGGAAAILGLGALSAVLAGACVAPVVVSVLLLAATLYGQGRTAGLVLPFLLGLGMALPWPLAGAGLAMLPKPGRWMRGIKTVLGLLILLAAGYYGVVGVRLALPKTPAAADPGWFTNLPEALGAAERSGQPVFVDIWASWCKNCQVMEATTLRQAPVRRALAGFIKVKLQAEQPGRPPDRDWLEALGVIGLPTYVILGRPAAPADAGAIPGERP